METQERVQQLSKKLRVLEAQPDQKTRSYSPGRTRASSIFSSEDERVHVRSVSPGILPDGTRWYGGVVPTFPKERSDRKTNRDKAWEWSNRRDLPPPRQLIQTLPPKFQKYQDAVLAKLREKIELQNDESKERRNKLREEKDAIDKLPDEVFGGKIQSRPVKKWMKKARNNLVVRRNQLDRHSKMTNEWAIPTLLDEVKREKGKEDADSPDRLLGNRDVSAQRLSYSPRA